MQAAVQLLGSDKRTGFTVQYTRHINTRKTDITVGNQKRHNEKEQGIRAGKEQGIRAGKEQGIRAGKVETKIVK